MVLLIQIGLPILIGALLGLPLFPRTVANHAPAVVGAVVAWLAGLVCLCSLGAGYLVLNQGLIECTFLRLYPSAPICIGMFLDPLAVVMLTLVGFIGWVIARFSRRYLEGDSNQGRFFQWISFTLGSTCLLIVSCNLLMLTAAWMLMSFGLHQLLIHYPERAWAIWAARKKFLISRLGDLFLGSALVLTFYQFGSLEYRDLFSAQDYSGVAEPGQAFTLPLIGILFVLGAMTKSAQFPFHSWLPDTMETPTPVSALMHAGIINAGGFLIIRLSPLIVQAPIALYLLTFVGAFTALFGSLVMLTQTSIKRSLAYSTIAQMGFMMLQCGLGAFSAALLHIVAHSAYKAHAFLRTGSAVEEDSAQFKPLGHNLGGIPIWIIAATLGMIIVGGSFFLTGLNVWSKPGGLVLSLVLIFAMVQFLGKGLGAKSPGLAILSLILAALAAASYCLAFRLMDTLVILPAPLGSQDAFTLEVILAGLVISGFLSIFVLQWTLGAISDRPSIKALYVHAMNGFYIDIPARKWTARLYGKSTPVQ